MQHHTLPIKSNELSVMNLTNSLHQLYYVLMQQGSIYAPVSNAATYYFNKM